MNFFASFKRQDWLLNLAIIFLAATSLVTIYSVAPEFLPEQMLWFGSGLIIIFLFSHIDWRTIVNYRWMVFGFYLVTIGLLLATLLFAPVIRQSRSWLVLGSYQFQPSELVKISLITLLAYFFARRHIGIAHFSNIALSFVYFLVPAVIIFLQPDWGSALVLGGVWIGFLLVSGIRWRHLAIGIIILVIFTIISWNFLLQEYQKERIIGFLEPSYDPLGVNYGVIQAKIAIGSAGFLGKGFRQGTQTQLGFLPEPATDFIFASFIEEWGFLGGTLVLAAFFFLIIRIIRVGLESKNNFSQLVSLGTALLFLTEFILNIGSNLALTPVVGVTFPFFSYGGSSLLTKSILVGIIQSSAIRNRF